MYFWKLHIYLIWGCVSLFQEMMFCNKGPADSNLLDHMFFAFICLQLCTKIFRNSNFGCIKQGEIHTWPQILENKFQFVITVKSACNDRSIEFALLSHCECVQPFCLLCRRKERIKTNSFYIHEHFLSILTSLLTVVLYIYFTDMSYISSM